MQSPKPISIIVNGTFDAAQRYIEYVTEALSGDQWRVDVICVDCRTTPNAQPSRIIGDVCARRASSIEDAVEMAYFETVAMIQGRPDLEPKRFQDLVEKLNATTFICSYLRPHLGRGYKRGLMWGHRLLNDVLLKSKVSQFDNAVLFFKRSNKTLSAITAAAVPLTKRTQSGPNFSQLVSGVKMAGGYHVVALQEQFAGKSKPAVGANSKSILSAIGTTIRTWWNGVMFTQTAPMETKRSSRTNRALKFGGWVLLCLIAAGMLSQNLNFPLFEPDEARNVQLALNMIDSGNWMSLELKDEHYWDKPPLVAWMTAISFQAFGVSESAARLPGILVTFLTAVMICAIGQRLVGFRAAWVASLLTLLSLGIPFSGRYLTMDSTLTMLATIACLAIYRGSFGRRFRQSWWGLTGVCVGLGLLTKGPVILVLCLPPALLFSWLTDAQIFQSRKQSRYFIALATLVGAPWYVATVIGTPDFLSHFLWKHHIVRFTEGLSHQQPFWFYLPVILLLMFPASQLLLPVVRFLGTRKPSVRRQRTRAHGYLFLCAMWVMVFFTFSTGKLPNYILPAVPMLCLLAASVIDINVFAKLDCKSASRENGVTEVTLIDSFYQKLPKWLAFNTTAWLLIVSFGMMWFLPEHSASLAVMTGSLALVIMANFVAAYKRSHPYAAWAAVGVLGLMMATLLVNRLIPAISKSRSIQMAVLEIQQHSGSEGLPVVYYARDSFATSMALPDSQVVYFSKEETSAAAAFLQNHPAAILVVAAEYVKGLQEAVCEKVALAKYEDARHVYRASPVPVAANVSRIAEARQQDSRR